MTVWPEHDAPWHCGQCIGGWDCRECHRLFSEPGDPPLLPPVVDDHVERYLKPSPPA